MPSYRYFLVLPQASDNAWKRRPSQAVRKSLGLQGAACSEMMFRLKYTLTTSLRRHWNGGISMYIIYIYNIIYNII